MENLKGHDWQINFSSIKHHEKDLTQFDFSEQALIDTWCCISKSVIYSIKVQMPLRTFDV